MARASQVCVYASGRWRICRWPWELRRIWILHWGLVESVARKMEDPPLNRVQEDLCLRKAPEVGRKGLLTSRDDSVSHTHLFFSILRAALISFHPGYCGNLLRGFSLPAQVTHSDRSSDSVSHEFKNLAGPSAGWGMLGLKSFTWGLRSLCCPVCVFAGLCAICHTVCTWYYPYFSPPIFLCINTMSPLDESFSKKAFCFFPLEFTSPSPNALHSFIYISLLFNENSVFPSWLPVLQGLDSRPSEHSVEPVNI